MKSGKSVTDNFQLIWKDALSQARAERQVEWDSLHAENLYGASMVGSCLRASYLSRAGYPTTNHPSQETQVIFDIGHQIESWFMDIISKYVVENNFGYIDFQAESKDDYHYAHTDGLWVTEDFAMPIEIKSIASDAVDYRERTNGGVWTPYPHHSLQIAQFMLLSERNGGYVAANGKTLPVTDTGLIFYIAKDGRIRISTVVLEELKSELLRRMSILEKAWDSVTPPEKQEDGDKYPCSFGKVGTCRFWDLCWGIKSPRTPKGSIAYLQGRGYEVKKKDSMYYVQGFDTPLTNEGLINFAVEMKENE